MRLVASDFITYWRPKPCGLRVFLKNKGEQAAEPSTFDEILRRLGLRHELEHLATLGEYLDLSAVPTTERVGKTIDAITYRTPVVYQPAFIMRHQISGTEIEIVGAPDFLIADGDGYLIRDSKMSRRIDSKSHPEIIVQVQLYGWLFQRTFGFTPKALQVYNGMKQIVDVPNDGGIWALAVVENLLSIKQLPEEPYEPVGWSKCNPCGFFERCWTKAAETGEVALIPEVDQSIARILRANGVSTRKDLLSNFDVTSLSNLKRQVKGSERRIGKNAERIIRCAEAMESGEEKILASPAIPQSANYAMFDLEGIPPHLDELDKIYLWGLQVFGEKPSEFMAAVSGFGPDGDKQSWLTFLVNAKKVFDSYGDIPFVHWAQYEETKLDLYIRRYGDAGGIAARVKLNLLDLLTVARESIVLPLPSYSLKVIEKHIGFRRTQHEYGGDWSMATFIEATETGDEGERTKLMNEILKYNQEDLQATWAVLEWLSAKAVTPAV